MCYEAEDFLIEVEFCSVDCITYTPTTINMNVEQNQVSVVEIISKAFFIIIVINVTCLCLIFFSSGQVFEDSFHQLRMRSAEEMGGRLQVNFHGEEGKKFQTGLDRSLESC